MYPFSPASFRFGKKIRISLACCRWRTKSTLSLDTRQPPKSAHPQKKQAFVTLEESLSSAATTWTLVCLIHHISSLYHYNPHGLLCLANHVSSVYRYNPHAFFTLEESSSSPATSIFVSYIFHVSLQTESQCLRKGESDNDKKSCNEIRNMGRKR
jgi:hypothetical protein